MNPNIENHDKRDIWINLESPKLKEMLMPLGRKINFKKHLWKTIDNNKVEDNPDYQE